MFETLTCKVYSGDIEIKYIQAMHAKGLPSGRRDKFEVVYED